MGLAVVAIFVPLRSPAIILDSTVSALSAEALDLGIWNDGVSWWSGGGGGAHPTLPLTGNCSHRQKGALSLYFCSRPNAYRNIILGMTYFGSNCLLVMRGSARQFENKKTKEFVRS
ncbi:hypothetical protein GQ55_9G607600 [Panicum hallii var. hallii]|uniref:Uncharacterized protein n=1 Tax=Panicum hallii var. hallii TaxID=1504633 RepID=A0A2T7CHE1_9POAL|nr:hypothetical protein GQ55_9G607600 [Panicum hallii var. hallii]